MFDKSLLEPVADTPEIVIPGRFADALTQIRFFMSRCNTLGIPKDTILAAMVTDLVPRLVEAYGPDKTALFLRHLAEEIA